MSEKDKMLENLSFVVHNLQEMKEAECLVEEEANRLEGALKTGALSEVHVAKLLIVGGREKLTSINERQRQLTDYLDKLLLKRKDAILHDQTISKKMKSGQQNQQNVTDIASDTI